MDRIHQKLGFNGLGWESECAEVRLQSVFETVRNLCERETFTEYKNTVTELWDGLQSLSANSMS